MWRRKFPGGSGDDFSGSRRWREGGRGRCVTNSGPAERPRPGLHRAPGGLGGVGGVSEDQAWGGGVAALNQEMVWYSTPTPDDAAMIASWETPTARATRCIAGQGVQIALH